MDTATKQAVPKTYIAEWIKLDFFNNSNLKTDIQNRISDNIEANFLSALNDMRGDNKNGYGISFSEITRLALAYFFNNIFTGEAKNHYYSLEMVKGFLDADNKTSYTAIHEIDVKFYPLNDAPLFNHCWLIIQSAWFFNSIYFGHHQHIDYVNHYINTGQKLPIEKYNFDQNYLQKKYEDIDSKKKEKIPINGYTLVNQWYFGILFLICKELQLQTVHFNINTIDNREYNPLPKTSRQLRPLAPFKIVEYDIKSAFPTFLDIETGATLKDHVYNNLMQSKGITRGEAKILFNKFCNSGKYKSKEVTKAFFMECGYNQTQCDHLLTLTHDTKRKFISHMTEYECKAIQNFAVMNNLQRGARLHDAIICIDDKTKPQVFTVPPNCDFGLKELNRPFIKETFSFSDKRLSYAYVGSIPKGLNLITKHEATKPDVKGMANGFKFYSGKFDYLSAGFNMNNYYEISKHENPYKQFISLCTEMLTVLHYLNKRRIKPLELEIILKHIRRQSNYIFNVRAVYLRLIKYNPTMKIQYGKRDFDIITDLKFKRKIDFLKAMNEAKKIVNVSNNYKDLIDLIQERIVNNDYGFLNEIAIKGHKRNNKLAIAIIHKFNVLCIGSKNKPYSDNLFINTTIKSLPKYGLSENELKKERAKFNRIQLKIKRANERIEQNKPIVQQLYLLVCSIAGGVTGLDIIKDDEVQRVLKHELIQDILKIDINNSEAGANCFDYLYQPMATNEIVFNTDLQNSFDTDMKKSIFNQLTLSEAQANGTIFLKQYLRYHKISQRKQEQYLKQKQKEQFEFSIIKFD
jgi:hypothetical protein